MHPRLRCPVCGLLTFFRNIGKEHKLQAFVYEIGGKIAGEKGRGRGRGRGKSRGKIVLKETQFSGPDRIEDYWIRVLEKVIAELKKRRVYHEFEFQSGSKSEIEIQTQSHANLEIATNKVVIEYG